MRPTSSARFVLTLFIAVCSAALLTACTSSPKIFVNENPNAKFSEYRTYNYLDTLGTDQRTGYSSILSKYLMNAMDREMTARGYKKTEDPELLVNFFVNTQEKIRTTSSPSMGGYYGYRGGYYGGYAGYDTTVTQYTEGTLSIDIVDSARDELLWEGRAEGKITDKVRENLELAANGAINEIMQKYTYTASGYVPPEPAE